MTDPAELVSIGVVARRLGVLTVTTGTRVRFELAMEHEFVRTRPVMADRRDPAEAA